MYGVCNDKKADGPVETGGELPLLVWWWWWTRVAKTSSNERPEAALTLSATTPLFRMNFVRYVSGELTGFLVVYTLESPPSFIKILPFRRRFYRKTRGETERASKRGYCDFPCGRHKVGWTSGVRPIFTIIGPWISEGEEGEINWRDCWLKFVGEIRIAIKILWKFVE